MEVRGPAISTKKMVSCFVFGVFVLTLEASASDVADAGFIADVQPRHYHLIVFRIACFSWMTASLLGEK